MDEPTERAAQLGTEHGTHQAYRFTAGDEVTIIGAIRRAVISWTHSPTKMELELVGAHSIGCSLYDLRDSEREWLKTAAVDATIRIKCEEVGP